MTLDRLQDACLDVLDDFEQEPVARWQIWIRNRRSGEDGQFIIRIRVFGQLGFEEILSDATRIQFTLIDFLHFVTTANHLTDLRTETEC